MTDRKRPNIDFRKYFTRSYVLRYLLILGSQFFFALGLTMLRLSCLGSDPFSGMAYSISEHWNVPLAAVIAGVNLCLIVFCFLKMPQSIGFGTFVNMVLTGNFADLWRSLLRDIFGLDLMTGADQLPQRLFMLIAGMLIMVFFCSFYLASELGTAPYDYIGYIIEDMTGGRYPFFAARMTCDGICVVVTYLVARMDGTQWQLIGFGTIILVLCIGPLQAFFRKHFADPLVAAIKRL